jgi:hypothetical protein
MFPERVAELREALPVRLLPSRIAADLVPVLEYFGRCTRPDHRLFVAGEAPELYVFAGRLFAGGQPALRRDFFDTVADQERLVARLRRQDVPLALVLAESDVVSFPVVMAALATDFRPVADHEVNGRPVARLLVSGRFIVRDFDAATGWPCFR